MNENEIRKPYSKFKGFLLENGITYKDVGEVIGRSTTTISMKINGQSDFSLSEIKEIADKFNAPIDIFLH